MGGFLSALGTLAGGFNTRRRIDEEGFDFREQERAKQFQRDRAEELARQADEERAVGIGTDIALGSDPGQEPDFSGLFPGQQMDQDLTRARIRGKVRQTKPALEAQEAYNKRLLEGDKQTGRVELQGLRADERDALVRLKADLDANRPPSPRDQFMADEAARRKGIGVQAMMQALQIRREDKLFPVDVTEGSETVRRFLTREEVRPPEGGEIPGFGRKSTRELNRIGSAESSLTAGEHILSELERPEFREVLGPIMGRGQTIMRNVGIGNPVATNLAATIVGLAALQPDIHGFRAYQFAKNLEEQLLNGEQTPESLAAGIQGLMQVSRVRAGQPQESFDPEAHASRFGDPEEKFDDLASTLTGQMSPEQLQQFLDALEGTQPQE